MSRRRRTLALVLAGGKGSRLGPLTQRRAKPALPFAGVYRLIDFPLTNCVHSGLSDVWVLEQYQPHALNDHLLNGRPWDLDRNHGGLRILPPFTGAHGEGFAGGNADALWRHRELLAESGADELVVLSADHVERVDLRDVLDAHRSAGARVTMVTTEVPVAEASRFGAVLVGGDGRVRDFVYKPERAAADDGTATVTTEVFAYDLADPDASSFALVTEGDEEIAGIGQIGFEWDPAEHRVTAWADGADVYTLTPPEDGDWRTAAWTWTRIPAADDNEVVPTVGINGTYSRFRYAPSVNAFLLVSTVDGPVWGYKAGAMPGTGPNGDDSGSESGTADDGSSSSNGDGGSTGGGGSTGDDGTSSTGTGAAEGSVGSVGSSSASDDDDASSCACTSGRGSGAAWNFAWMLALAIARRRPVTACRQRACAPPRAATPARVVASTRA